MPVSFVPDTQPAQGVNFVPDGASSVPFYNRIAPAAMPPQPGLPWEVNAQNLAGLRANMPPEPGVESLGQHLLNTYKNLANGQTSAADLFSSAPQTDAAQFAQGINRQINVPNAVMLGMAPEVMAAKQGVGLLLNAVARGVFAGQGAQQLGQSEGARTANQAQPYQLPDLRSLLNSATGGAPDVIMNKLGLPAQKPQEPLYQKQPGEGGEQVANSLLSALMTAGSFAPNGEIPRLSRVQAESVPGAKLEDYPQGVPVNKQLRQGARFIGPEQGPPSDIMASQSAKPKIDFREDPAVLQAVKDAEGQMNMFSGVPMRDPTKLMKYSDEDLNKYLTVGARFGQLSRQEPGSPEHTKIWQEYENIRNKYNGNPPLQLQGIQDIRPAVRTMSNELKVGEKGDTHNDIITRNKLQPTDIDRRLFVDSKGNEISREQLAQAGVPGEPKSVPGAHSTGLSEVQNAIQKPSTEEVYVQPTPNNRQAVEQGIPRPQGVAETREAGSITDESQRQVALGSGIAPTEENKRMFVNAGEKLLGNVKEFGFPTTAQLDSQQIKNRLRNKLGENSGEWKMWEGLGIDKYLSEGKKTPTEVSEWMKQNGPKVEVRKFGASVQTDLQKEATGVRHQWYDSLEQKSQATADGYVNNVGHPEIQKKIATEFSLDNGIPITQAKAQLERWARLRDVKNNQNMSHWQSIAPKSEQDMPGYVEIAVVKDKNLTPQFRKENNLHPNQEGENIQFPSSHSFPPNTLGFVRGYMEGDTFHVIEVQSDWAQQAREQKEMATRENMPINDQNYKSDYVNRNNEPLLPHYERLALKAAIDHARSEGATKIAISDAETAMMTEGHDRSLGYGNYEGNPKPIQDAGMRLHYDRTLPKIIEELTGSKGEKVSFGEHRMAMDVTQERRGDGPITELPKQPRKDLIFRNEVGQPKTDVSARVFPLGKIGERLEAGEPMTMMGKMYSGVPLPDIEGLKKLTEKPIVIVSDMLKRGETVRAMTYKRDAVDNLSAKIANEAANDVAGPLRRMTAKYGGDFKQAKSALAVVREANGDIEKLKSQLNDSKLEGFSKQPKAKEWIAAAKYGLEHWNVINAVAERFYKPITDSLIADVVGSGKDVQYREGYVRHMPEAKGAASFTHAREYPTLFDRIKAGSDPKSLDAIDLLRSGVADAQKLYVQSKAYINWMESVKDPVNGKPIALPFEKFEKGRPDRKDAPDMRPPSGYVEGNVGGQRVAIQEEYAKTLKALTDPSWFDQSTKGKALQEAAGTAKHVMFAFDIVHLARIVLVEAGAKVGTGNLPKTTYGKGILSLDYSPAELERMAKVGEIDKADLPQILANKKINDQLITHGFNIGRVVDALHQHWTEKIPLTGSFQKWLFGTFQRGAMAEVGPLVLETYKAQYPKLSEDALYAKTAHDLNVNFRTLGRQTSIFGPKSRTGQDMLRLFLAAPQWTEGTLMYEGGAVKGAAEGLAGKGFNIQSRTIGSIVAAYIVFNQVINLATKGQLTFDNEDGHKMDAWIPSKDGGFWLSPTATAMEALHAIKNASERSGDDALETAKQYIDPKLSGIARPAAVALTGHAWGMTGPVVPKSERLKVAAESAIPKPIGVEAMVNPQSGTTERQLLRSAGMNVDQQTTDRNEMYKAARKFMHDNKIPQNEGEYPASKYLDLVGELRANNLPNAKKAYESLKEEMGRPDAEALIKEYFKQYPNRGFTTSTAVEEQFRDSLTAQQQEVYARAKQQNEEVKDRFFGMMGESAPKTTEKKKGKKKYHSIIE